MSDHPDGNSPEAKGRTYRTYDSAEIAFSSRHLEGLQALNIGLPVAEPTKTAAMGREAYLSGYQGPTVNTKDFAIDTGRNYESSPAGPGTPSSQSLSLTPHSISSASCAVPSAAGFGGRQPDSMGRLGPGLSRQYDSLKMAPTSTGRTYDSIGTASHASGTSSCSTIHPQLIDRKTLDLQPS
eukprot:gene3330-3832_t